jgi:hypothetical protein
MADSAQHWPVDAHVHFHRPERAAATLDAAAVNFQAVAGRGRDDILGGLLLAQSASERVFESLRERRTIGAWELATCASEPETLVARRDGACLFVVCGRQVRSADGVEVLALGTCDEFDDGRALAQIVGAVRRSGAITVLPWGFGKWLGNRGRRVAAIMDDSGAQALYLGDNGARLQWQGRPARIRTMERLGFRVLPGTDPFPFGDDHRRVGGFGFMSGADFDPNAPWRRLRAWLLEQTVSPVPYGRASSPMRFVVNQGGIHLYRAAASRRRSP